MGGGLSAAGTFNGDGMAAVDKAGDDAAVDNTDGVSVRLPAACGASLGAATADKLRVDRARTAGATVRAGGVSCEEGESAGVVPFEDLHAM